MTQKTFDELEIGDFVADMHDGIAPVRARFVVSFYLQWDAMTDGSTFPFGNKELRVLGVGDGAIVCAYDYDRTFAGIVVLSGDRKKWEPVRVVS